MFHLITNSCYLGLEKTATQTEIDQAYLRKVQTMNHYPGNMKKDLEECLEAYETLIDEDLRKQYDQHVEISDIVRNVTDSKSDFIHEGAALFSGKSGRNGQDESFNAEQRHSFWKFTKVLLVIVLLPKALYIAYTEMKTL